MQVRCVFVFGQPTTAPCMCQPNRCLDNGEARRLVSGPVVDMSTMPWPCLVLGITATSNATLATFSTQQHPSVSYVSTHASTYLPNILPAPYIQVLVAPHPRVPGLLNALLPLLSTVLAPAVLDLNTAAFSELGLDEAALIGACLVVNSSLETLKLRAIGLRPDSLPLVLRGMVTHSCLRSVDLSFNNIGDNGVKLLADTIPHLPNLNAILLVRGVCLRARAL